MDRYRQPRLRDGELRWEKDGPTRWVDTTGRYEVTYWPEGYCGKPEWRCYYQPEEGAPVWVAGEPHHVGARNAAQNYQERVVAPATVEGASPGK